MPQDKNEMVDVARANAALRMTESDDQKSIRDIEARLAKLEAWAKGYAGPLLFRALDFGEKTEINKKTPYDPPKDRDRPDLKLREL